MTKGAFLFWLFIFPFSEIFSQGKAPDLDLYKQNLFFEESFEDNSRNWITNNDYLTGSVKNGIYSVSCKNYMESTGISCKSLAINYSGDFAIESSVKISKGTGGLIFGMNNNYFHYRIEIDAGRNIHVLRMDSKLKELQRFENSGSFSGEKFNKIIITRIDGVYSLFINDSFIGTFGDIKPFGDHAGFNIGLGSVMEVEYLKVSSLGKQTPTIAVTEQLQSVPEKKNVITWLSPSSERIEHDLYNVRVSAQFVSETEIQSVKFYLNGQMKGEAERKMVDGKPGNYQLTKTLELEAGENTIYFLVEDVHSKTYSSPNRYITIKNAVKPVITWVNPETPKIIVNSNEYTIEACIKTPSSLRSVKLLINGNLIGEDKIFEESGDNEQCKVRWKYALNLIEGIDQSINLVAENAAGFVQSDIRTVRYTKEVIEKRIALVVGNSNYAKKASLRNSINDASLMEAQLRKLNFEVVKYVDLKLDSLEKVYRKFSRDMMEYDVSLFYYAGHGVSVGGVNYLVPVDAELARPEMCSLEAFNLNRFYEEFAKYPKKTNIVILDACRNNSFTGWSRGDSNGFVPVTSCYGTFTGYATAPGKTAADGTTGNSPFTEELVRQMDIPQTIESVFINTRNRVMERSNNQQMPTYTNELSGTFYFTR